ncbi:hypothetical protein KFK09_007811 [Dendrobium nobile]|uniref:Uncharacterized protein n=1 Tax=Dendrobium nobile TaxID=94219 RepID=A0A8T3BVC9_DENNO|nr:hypothetical protein KFK09_007811 [Dendrobium nobile]
MIAIILIMGGRPKLVLRLMLRPDISVETAQWSGPGQRVKRSTVRNPAKAARERARWRTRARLTHASPVQRDAVWSARGSWFDAVWSARGSWFDALVRPPERVAGVPPEPPPGSGFSGSGKLFFFLFQPAVFDRRQTAGNILPPENAVGNYFPTPFFPAARKPPENRRKIKKPPEIGYVQKVVLVEFFPFCASCKCIGHVPDKRRHGSADLHNATLNPSINLAPFSVENIVVPSVTEKAEQVLGCDVSNLEDVIAALSHVTSPFEPPVHDLGYLVPVSLAPLFVNSLIGLVSVDKGVAIVSTVKVSKDGVAGVLPSIYDPRACASVGGHLGCAINSCPVLSDVGVVSAPCVLSLNAMPCVAMENSGESGIPNELSPRNLGGERSVTPSSVVIEGSTTLITHVGANLEESVRMQLDWLQCSSDSSSEASRDDDEPVIDFILHNDHPVVSISSCMWEGKMWEEIISGDVLLFFIIFDASPWLLVSLWWRLFGHWLAFGDDCRFIGAL